MPSRSSYQEYKQNTSYLLYWIINNFNALLNANPPNGHHDANLAANTTGQTTVAGFVSMAKFIAKHCDSIPSPIYLLFKSIIKARSAAHQAYLQLAATKNDAAIEKNNSTHKHFIDALTDAFDVLGGNRWQDDKEAVDKETTDHGDDVELGRPALKE